MDDTRGKTEIKAMVVKDHDLKAFKDNFTLMATNMTRGDPCDDIRKFQTWVNWVRQGRGGQGHYDYYFTEGLPLITKTLLKRSFKDAEPACSMANAVVYLMVDAIVQHLPLDLVSVSNMLPVVLSERNPMYLQHSLQAPDSGMSWIQSLNAGEQVDVEYAPGEWDTLSVTKVSKARTDIEVETADGKLVQIPLDEHVAPGGSGGALPLLPWELEWRSSVTIGDMVDGQHSITKKWYQAVIINVTQSEATGRDELHIALVGFDLQLAYTASRTSPRIAKVNQKSFGQRGDRSEDLIPADQELSVDGDNTDSEDCAVVARTSVWVALFQVNCAKYFLERKNGMRAILQRLDKRDADGKLSEIPFTTLRDIMVSLGEISHVLTLSFAQEHVRALYSSVRAQIKSFSTENLRTATADGMMEIVNNMRRLLRRITDKTKTAHAAEMLQLDFASLCGQSGNLARRLDGLRIAQEMILMVENTMENVHGFTQVQLRDSKTLKPYNTIMPVPMARYLTVPILVEWVESQKLIESNFETDPHTELMRRSFNVLQFLANVGALTHHHLELVWKAGDTADISTRNAIMELLGNLCDSLAEHHLEQLLAQLRTAGAAALDEPAVKFLAKIAAAPQSLYHLQQRVEARALAEMTEAERAAYTSKRIAEGFQQSWLVTTDSPAARGALEWMFELTTSGGAEVAAVAEPIVNCFVEVLCKDCWSHVRTDFLQRCVDAIKSRTSVLVALKLLQRIIETFPTRRAAAAAEGSDDSAGETAEHDAASADGVMIQSEVILRIVPAADGSIADSDATRHPVVDMVLEELMDFKSKALAQAQKLELVDEDGHAKPGADVAGMQVTDAGIAGYTAELRQRLEFLGFVLLHSKLHLGDPDLRVLWDQLITASLCAEERGLCYLWLSRACLALAKVAMGRTLSLLFVEEAAHELFISQMRDETFIEGMELPGFTCWKHFFAVVNAAAGNCRIVTESGDFEIKSKDMIGLDLLWTIVLRCDNNETASAASTFLTSLQNKLAPELQPQATTLRSTLLDQCMTHLAAVNTHLTGLAAATGALNSGIPHASASAPISPVRAVQRSSSSGTAGSPFSSQDPHQASPSAAVHRADRCLTVLRALLDDSQADLSQRQFAELEALTGADEDDMSEGTANRAFASGVAPFMRDLGVPMSTTLTYSPKLASGMRTYRLSVQYFPGERLADTRLALARAVGLKVSEMRVSVNGILLDGPVLGKTAAEAGLDVSSTFIAIGTTPSEIETESDEDTASEATDSLPAVLLSSRDGYFKTLLALADSLSCLASSVVLGRVEDSKQLHTRTEQSMQTITEILSRLPVAKAVVDSLHSLGDGSEDTLSPDAWSKVLQSESAAGMRYALTVAARSFTNSSSRYAREIAMWNDRAKDAKDAAELVVQPHNLDAVPAHVLSAKAAAFARWREVFVQRGGVHFLLDAFANHKGVFARCLHDPLAKGCWFFVCDMLDTMLVASAIKAEQGMARSLYTVSYSRPQLASGDLKSPLRFTGPLGNVVAHYTAAAQPIEDDGDSSSIDELLAGLDEDPHAPLDALTHCVATDNAMALMGALTAPVFLEQCVQLLRSIMDAHVPLDEQTLSIAQSCWSVWAHAHVLSPELWSSAEADVAAQAALLLQSLTFNVESVPGLSRLFRQYALHAWAHLCTAWTAPPSFAADSVTPKEVCLQAGLTALPFDTSTVLPSLAPGVDQCAALDWSTVAHCCAELFLLTTQLLQDTASVVDHAALLRPLQQYLVDCPAEAVYGAEDASYVYATPDGSDIQRSARRSKPAGDADIMALAMALGLSLGPEESETNGVEAANTSFEEEGETLNHMLIGCLQLLRVLVDRDAGVKAMLSKGQGKDLSTSELVGYLWNECLFACPQPVEEVAQALQHDELRGTQDEALKRIHGQRQKAEKKAKKDATPDAQERVAELDAEEEETLKQYPAEFVVPTAKCEINPTDGPKCKSHPARTAAFQLLQALCKQHVRNTAFVLAKTSDMIEALPVTTNFRNDPNADVKSSTGFVGLVNLGCTCYMNSLTQQLFMIRPLRTGLLQAPARNATTAVQRKESMLYQLQRMFGHLTSSSKVAYHTASWTHSYKDYDGKPTNPLIQQDAQEYFNRLCDLLEGELGGSPQAKLIQSNLRGAYARQLVCGSCGDASSRPEHFYCISLQVKHKRNVEESLNQVTAGEKISGFKCSKCEETVTVTKSTCLGELTDTTILHLGRFELNYETFAQEKVNDRFEFPRHLDLYPYSVEGVAWKAEVEAAVAAGEAAESVPRQYTIHPREYYEFDLAGVVVHQGSANSGHYYSFIRDRKAPQAKPVEAGVDGDEDLDQGWYQFNDSAVTPFDPAKLPEETFGGETQSSWDGKRKAIEKNAYMLFYQRKRSFAPTIEESESASAAESEDVPAPPSLNREFSAEELLAGSETMTLPSSVAASVWRENAEFTRVRHIHDGAFAPFISRLARQSVELLDSQPDYDAGFDVDFAAANQDRRRPLSTEYMQLSSLHGERDAAAEVLHEQQLQRALTLADEAVASQGSLATPLVYSVLARFAFNVVAHGGRGVRLQQTYPELAQLLGEMAVRSIPIARLELRTASVSPKQLKDQLLRCPEAAVRTAYGKYIEALIHGLQPHEAARLLETHIVSLPKKNGPAEEFDEYVTSTSRFAEWLTDFTTLDSIGQYWKQFEAFWQLVLELTRMSRGMRELLVQEKVVAKMIDFYMGNESPLQGTVFKDGQRKRAVMGNKYGRPKWSTMIQAVSELVCGCHTAATQSNGSVDSPGADEPAGALPPTTIVSHDASGNPPPLLTLDELSSKCVLNRHFFQAALQHQDNGRAIGRIMAHQSWGWGKFSEHAVNILVTGVEAADYDDCHAYFQAMDELLSVKDSLRVWRMQELFQDGDHSIMGGVKTYFPKYIRFVCTCAAFMLGVLLRQPDVAMALHTIDQEPAARESLGCGAMGLFAFMEASAYAYRTRSIGIGHRSVSDRHLKDLVLSAAGIEEEMVWTDDPDDGVVASLSLADAEGEIAKLKSLDMAQLTLYRLELVLMQCDGELLGEEALEVVLRAEGITEESSAAAAANAAAAAQVVVDEDLYSDDEDSDDSELMEQMYGDGV